MDLMRTYIHQHRFGDFVKHFIQDDRERRKAKAEKEDDFYLWIAFVHSQTDKRFKEWKAEILGGSTAQAKAGGDADLDDAGIMAIINKTFKG